MGYIIAITIGGLLLWLLFRGSEEKAAQKAAERAEAYQAAKSNYDRVRREARDAYRKMAEEKYTKLGLAELLPHMVVEDSDVEGEIRLRWVGLSPKQEQLLMQTLYKDEDSELVGRERELAPPVCEDTEEVDVTEYVQELTQELIDKKKSCSSFLLPYAAAYLLSEMPQMTVNEYTETFGVDISQSAYQKYMGPLFKHEWDKSSLSEIDIEYYKKKIARHFNL